MSVKDRRIRYVTDRWYYFQDWLSYGQRSSPAEWIIEYGVDQIDPQLQERIYKSMLFVGCPQWMTNIDSVRAASIRRMYDQERRKQQDRAAAKAKAMAKYIPVAPPFPMVPDRSNAPRSKH